MTRLSRWRRSPLLLSLAAVIAALATGALLMMMAGANPLQAYATLFQEALFTYFGFGSTLTKTTPLLLTGLGILVALRAGQFNLGGEGQIYFGGLGSLLVGLYGVGLPLWIHLPLALLGGFVFGALWGAIAGLLKVGRGLNEVLTTLLLNYVAQNIVGYLVNGPLIEPGAPSPYSALVAETARLPKFLPQSQAHVGIFLGLAIALFLSFVFTATPLGYQIDATGQNPTAARYAGIPVGKTIVGAMAVSGGLAGLAGSAEVLGLRHRLFENFVGGYGFDAIAIALLSRGSPLIVVLTSFFFGALRSGASVMQRSAGVPITVVSAIQGLTLLFIAISFALESKQQQIEQPVKSQKTAAKIADKIAKKS